MTPMPKTSTKVLVTLQRNGAGNRLFSGTYSGADQLPLRCHVTLHAESEPLGIQVSCSP
jgi:hypothetical protein